MNVNSTILEIQRTVKISNSVSPSTANPASVAAVSLASISTLLLIYYMNPQKNGKKSARKYLYSTNNPRSTPLPGFGIFGDRVNEFIEIFLDALAVYVHHDKKSDCQRRFLCEANQRQADYGIVHGILMYFMSLAVSFWLGDQKVSDSMEAMRKGRQGQDCGTSYPKCPFSL